MKIYTRTGDAGATSLATGERVPKTDPRLVAYGTCDELNSFAGRLRALCGADPRFAAPAAQILKIQSRLFEVGGMLAGGKTPFAGEAAAELELWMDQMTAGFPPRPFVFVLPGNTLRNAEAHVCRTVCRRFERELLLVEGAPQQVRVFVNRLSDYFFVLSRHFSFAENVEETVWGR
jgi:cob(I)alamin adenosyltransferase